MTVQVEDGRIRRIEAHPDNRATAQGVCLKGLSYFERAISPDRILHPLRRKPGTGDFVRVSWDEALETIVATLKRVREESGPQSVFYYAGSGTKGLLNGVGMEFWKLYGGCTTTYGDLCWPAGLEATRLTLGDNKHNVPWDLAHAKLIVFWGKNAAETNIQQMNFVNEAVENGAKLVVIDPRRTETSERAHLHIQPRPGTDGAIALAVAQLLIRDGGTDTDFVERHVHGFPEFAKSVAGFTAQKAAEIADVPTASIDKLAALFGSTRPATICAGYGMQRYTNSGQTMRAMLALLGITGNFGKPGAGWIFANLQSAIFDQVKDPIAFYPPAAPGGDVRVSISTAMLGRHMLDSSNPGLRMAWVERGNPITQNPDTNRVLEAFRALEFRVVVDQFMTDTAREADIILPAKTMFEQTDVIGAYWHPYIQIKQKAIDPPGEVKPETEVYHLLAQRLGFTSSDIQGKIPGPSDEEVEAFLADRLAPFDGLSLEALRRGPILAPGNPIAFSDGVFPTPSGKIELMSQEAVERWGVERLPDFKEPVESMKSPGASKGYPLHFITPNTKNRIHSQFNNLRMIGQFGDRPEVHVHPADAAARGIGDGARVRIRNERGGLVVHARIDNGIKRGCISVTNGWWITQGGSVNNCSLGRETDMGHGAAFHDNLVEIEPAR